MLMILVLFLVAWELFYCSFRIAILTVCLFQSTEMIRGGFPLLHRVRLPCNETPGTNYCTLHYDLNPTATRDCSPIPSVSSSQLCASPKLYFVLPAASFPVYMSAVASLAMAKGFGKSKNKQVFPQAAGSCVPLFLPPSFTRSQKCHLHLMACISCAPF